MEREVMEFDVVIVGAGPSGLATSIRLKQLAAENDSEISVCVLEKGSEVGAHILSGAVFERKRRPAERTRRGRKVFVSDPQKGFFPARSLFAQIFA
jgi:ribulose 1,5-bisphosphate synthetase/thiazole synthase